MKTQLILTIALLTLVTSIIAQPPVVQQPATLPQLGDTESTYGAHAPRRLVRPEQLETIEEETILEDEATE